MFALIFRLAATIAAFVARLRPHTTGPPLGGPHLVVPLPALGPGARVEVGLSGRRPAVRLLREGPAPAFAGPRLPAARRPRDLPPWSSGYDDGLDDVFGRDGDDEFAAGYDDALVHGRYDDVDGLGAGGPFGYGAPPGRPDYPPPGRRPA